jgi:nucleoporin NUP159
MNVTRLQQPPLQSGSARPAIEAEDTTPDVRSLISCDISQVVLRHDISQFLSIRLVNKRTRAKLSPEPLDLTPIPNKGQLFVVASALGWFVAIIRSNTGLGAFIVWMT